MGCPCDPNNCPECCCPEEVFTTERVFTPEERAPQDVSSHDTTHPLALAAVAMTLYVIIAVFVLLVIV